MYKKILVPLDGSKLAEAAVIYAKDLAGRLNLDLVLLHVCNPLLKQYAPMHRIYIEHTAAVAAQRIRHVQEKLSGGKEVKEVNVRGELVIGYPPEEILRHAEQENVDIIMMTTHGHSGLMRWAMGSVADKVLRASKIPVCLARVSEANGSTAEKWLTKTIMVPLDGSNIAEAVLPHVRALARQCDAELEEIVLLRVCEYPFIAVEYPEENWTRYVNLAIENCKHVSEQYLARAKKRLQCTGLEVYTKVFTGDAADVIIDYAKEHPSSLIVMSTHGYSGVGRWVFGSVADKVLHGVSSPVFLVRSG